MKKIFILLIIILFTKSSIVSQWQVQLDLQNSMYVDRIHFIDENNGWSIGGCGYVFSYIFTTDGGQNWNLCDNWINISGYDIIFLNPDTGFIGSLDGVIYKTIDKGQIWNTIQTPTIQDIYRLLFVNNNSGWGLIGPNSDGNILHTDDGGNNWSIQQVFYESLSYEISSLFFLNDSVGWASGFDFINNQAMIKKTINQGNTWETIYTGFNLMPNIFLIDSLKGWASIYNNEETNYIQTFDGGITWEEKLLQIKDDSGNITGKPEIMCIEFFNDTLGWITGFKEENEGNEGYIFLTVNGGENWLLQFRNGYLYEPIYDISVVDINNAWACGVDYIYYNNNADSIIYTDVEYLGSSQLPIKVSPNPFTDYIHFDFDEKYENYYLIISDLGGKICFEKKIKYNDILKLDFLERGVYIINIYNNQKPSYIQKIIKI